MTFTLGRRQMLVGLALLPVLRGSIAFAQEAQEPVRGGILTGKISADPTSFDIVSGNASNNLNCLAPCYNALVMQHPLNSGEIIGDLATEWQVADDGLRYTFKIVQNATFHDGVPLTSADVKYSLDLIRNPPDGISSVREPLLEAISNITTPDPFTVVIDLSRPSVTFLNLLTDGWILIMPKHVLEASGNQMNDVVVGSGPFKLGAWTPGTSVELVRNEDYHVPDRPFLDGITYYVVPDLGTVSSYFSTEQLLIWDAPDPKDARRVKAEMGDQVIMEEVEGVALEGLTINHRREPLSDPKVREAISLAIDKQEAVKVILNGEGTVGGFMRAGRWELPADQLAQVSGFGPDPAANKARARELLAEAGYADGLSLEITARKAAGVHEAKAVLTQSQLAEVGIEATIKLEESASYFESLKTRNFDICTFILNGVADDPDIMFAVPFACAAQLSAGACDVEVNPLFLQQQQIADFDERLRLVHQLELDLLNEFIFIPMGWKTQFQLTNAKVHGMRLHPNRDSTRRMQDVWISA